MEGIQTAAQGIDPNALWHHSTGKTVSQEWSVQCQVAPVKIKSNSWDGD